MQGMRLAMETGQTDAVIGTPSRIRDASIARRFGDRTLSRLC